jgi:hypothetical protein
MPRSLANLFISDQLIEETINLITEILIALGLKSTIYYYSRIVKIEYCAGYQGAKAPCTNISPSHSHGGGGWEERA